MSNEVRKPGTYVMTSVSLELVEYGRFGRTPIPLLGNLTPVLHDQNPTGFWKYMGALGLVARWQGGDTPLEDFRGENDYQHIGVCTTLMWQMYLGWPKLYRALDGDRTYDMVVVHDGGEIAVGDVAQSEPDVLRKMRDPELAVQHQKAKDGRELEGFREVVLPMFANRFHEQIMELYLSYEKRVSGVDIAAHATKWVDIMAGNKIAMEYFYRDRTDLSVKRMRELTIPKFLAQTQIIRDMLLEKLDIGEWYEENDDKDTWWDFLHFTGHHLAEIVGYGYGEELTEFEEQYGELLGELRGVVGSF